MNLRQLELFVAVAESKSFSRGAELIHLTQSTVSQHIAALEDEVGARLFDRTTQGALLTPAGKVFLRHARRVLSEQEQLLEEMAAFHGQTRGQLRIGASNIPANYLVPSLLPKLAEQHPGISVHMQSGTSREMLNKLLEGEVELSISGSRPESDKLECKKLTDDVLVLIVAPSHPWCQRQEIALEELPTQPLIVRERGSGSERALLQELQRIGFATARLQIAARLGSNEAVRRVVAGGYGYAFVSVRSVQRELDSGELCTLPVSGLTVERQFWLVQRRGRTLSPAALAFSELLLQSCQTGRQE